MDTVDAYCTICDAEIRVRIPPGGTGELKVEDLECLHADLCSPQCILEREGTSIAELLDFLPPEESGRRRGFSGASRLVEEARRTSLARERRRWLKWWGGR